MTSNPYILLERLVAQALTADDPVAGFVRAAQSAELPDELRTALSRAEPRGIRMAALLITRLRFERLMKGSPTARERFQRVPEEFTGAFLQYHRSVPPTAITPREEAGLFMGWSES